MGVAGRSVDDPEEEPGRGVILDCQGRYGRRSGGTIEEPKGITTVLF